MSVLGRARHPIFIEYRTCQSTDGYEQFPSRLPILLLSEYHEPLRISCLRFYKLSSFTVESCHDSRMGFSIVTWLPRTLKLLQTRWLRAARTSHREERPSPHERYLGRGAPGSQRGGLAPPKSSRYLIRPISEDIVLFVMGYRYC